MDPSGIKATAGKGAQQAFPKDDRKPRRKGKATPIG